MQTLRSLAALVEAGLAPADPRLVAAEQTLAIALTPAMHRAIDPARDTADPIARQFVPSVEETVVAPEELADPIGDRALAPVPGIVHRYPDRVLLKPTHVCPVYCRFCFRREQVGPGGEALSAAELEAALAYIAAHPAIFEVILTGGDPLMLAPARLARLVEALDAIPHVQVIRVHSRVPVADPERVTADLVAALAPRRAALWLGIHSNHEAELGEAQRAALRQFAVSAIPLFGQTVLLRGINDDAETLEKLFRRMLVCGVKPYYLHHPDLVRGTAHFRVDLARGREIMRGLRGRLSGLAQPVYVLDVPGGHGKVPVGPGYLADDPEGWRVEDAFGASHRYPPV